MRSDNILTRLAAAIDAEARELDELRQLKDRLSRVAVGMGAGPGAWDEGCAGVYLREWPDGRQTAYIVSPGGAHPPSVGGHNTVALYTLAGAAALLLKTSDNG